MQCCQSLQVTGLRPPSGTHRVVVAGRSSGGRRGGPASAAESWATPVAVGAAGWAATCPGALRNARSTRVSAGRGLCRRSTAASWRSTRISTSLAALDRASSASQLSTRASARYASRTATASEHAGRLASGDCEGRPPAMAQIGGRDTVLGTHRARIRNRRAELRHVYSAIWSRS
jgi:hypothetical protein